MLLSGSSAIVVAVCIAASAWRLSLAVAPTPLDPSALCGLLRGDIDRPALARLVETLAHHPDFAWEHGVIAALMDPPSAARDAFVGEQLTELDAKAARWARVPRVCASVAMNAGFLFGTVAILQSLSGSAPADAAGASGQALFGALDALAIGLAGATFCASIHALARRSARERQMWTDRLVDRLRALSPTDGDEPS
ncbi:MAG: hypothetical protein ABSC94_30425 [Polyangiaceae bacterium]